MVSEHLLLAPLASAILTVVLILLLKPLLVRYALARPNARSSHNVPTPQGGGIAIMGALVVVLIAAAFFTPWSPPCDCGNGLSGILSFLARQELAVVFVAAILLAFVGAFDDIKPLPARSRLALQFVAVTAIILVTKMPGRIFPADIIPSFMETGLIILGGVWFVNLVNFMDGLDWMTVAEMVPITAFFTFMGVYAVGPAIGPAALVAGALCGALVGFAIFNKPVAKLFLGDVGSLPIGLIVGWLLLMLAGAGAPVAAILLPLYYLMDATITLVRRFARGEKVWEAHRSHFYQKATDNGFSVMSVIGHVFVVNLVLAGLATVTLFWPSVATQILCLVAGVGVVSVLLMHFSRPRLVVAR